MIRSFSLKRKILLISVAINLVIIGFGVYYLSHALESIAWSEARAYLEAKSHAITLHLTKTPPDLKSAVQEAQWSPSDGARLPVFTRIAGCDSATILDQYPASWKMIGWSLLGSSPPSPIERVSFGDSEGLRWKGQVGCFEIEMVLDMRAEIETLATQKIVLDSVLIAGLVVFLIASFFLSRVATAPLSALQGDINRLHSKDLHSLDRSSYPTELQPIVEEINALYLQLADRIESLTHFAQHAAHELRNPLSNLIGGTEVALARDRSPDDYKETLASNLEEMRRLARIVQVLLLISRNESGNSGIHIRVTSCSDFIERVRELVLSVTEGGPLELQTECIPSLSLPMDPEMMAQAVFNLVNNAVQHAAGATKLVLRVYRTEGFGFIEVEDDGCGIADQHGSRVFDRFYRVVNTRSPDLPLNTGLGLALVRSIAHAHGGDVHLSSEIGKGSTFRIQFPAL